jgi:hypothetical protein
MSPRVIRVRPHMPSTVPNWESLTRRLRTGRIFLQLIMFGIAGCVMSPDQTWAQGWKCITPVECGTIIPVNSIASFALRLEHTQSHLAAGVSVKIRTSGGTLYVAGVPVPASSDSTFSATTDQNGVVTGYISGAESGQRIHFNAVMPNGTFQEQSLRVVGAAPTLHTDIDRYALYVGSQVRDVSVYTSGLDDEACRKSVVRFSPRGSAGSVSVDSAYGEPGHGRCSYSTDWRLGSDVGRQVLQVRNGSAVPLQIQATARRKSTLRVGLAGVLRRGNISNIVNTRSSEHIKVQRPGEGGAILEYDSVPRADTVKASLKWEPEAIPFILLDTPLRPGWEHVRVAVGASALNFRRDFFAGLSVGQLRWGIQPEDVGFDVQFGFLFSRPDRLENPSLCQRDIRAASAIRTVSCKTTSDMRWDGVGLTVSTDAQALVGSIGKLLGFGA